MSTLGWFFLTWGILSIPVYGFLFCCFAVSNPSHEDAEDYQRGTNPERAQDGRTAQIIQFTHR